MHDCKCVTGGVPCASQWLHHPFNETSVQVNYEHSQEGHLLARVFKDDPWVIRLTSEAVRGHHHGEVIHIHLGYSYVGWLCEHLEVNEM